MSEGRSAADAALDRAAATLSRVWERRSSAEQSAFGRRPSAVRSAPEHPSTSLRRLRERAALCGAVSPVDLVRGEPPEAAARLLDLASSDFDRALTSVGWRWTLRSGVRRETLTRLAAEGTLASRLDEVAALPTDEAGRLLREVTTRRVAGVARPAFPRVLRPGEPPDRDVTDWATTIQALTWARPVGGVAGDLAEARRRAALAALGEGYAVLLRHGLFGREREMARLGSFAESPIAALHAGGESGPVPVMPVVGIGGSGKSTVIAALIRPYLRQLAMGDPAAPMVAVIDFDRVRFRGEAQLELSFEVSRQLGWAAPAAGADFSVLRRQTRAELRETQEDTYGGSEAVESDIRGSHSFDAEASTIVDLHGLRERPVLLVLDTFEEWQRERPWTYQPRGPYNDPEQRILDWITGLRDVMGLLGLRVVVSGRADMELPQLHDPSSDRQVSLGELEPDAAAAVLASVDVPGDAAPALASTVGGNPLTLRVAARFFLKLPDGERQAFLSGGEEVLGPLDEQMRRSVLYDRFLRHIPDERVRSLAHPGLVLRRVTPEIVQRILAPLSKLGQLTAGQAEELTERLADEVWLVKRTETGLRHQPDVRRAMLRMMSTDPATVEVVARIHRAAADWYRAPDGRGMRQERALSAEAAEIEWFYHSLMLEPAAWQETLEDPAAQDRWTRLALALGPGVVDLPPALRAQVRVVRGDEVSDDEGGTLPDVSWQRWIARRGTALTEEGRGAVALGLAAERLARRTVAEPPWLARAFCDTARWDEYWEVAEQLPAPGGPDARSVRLSGRYQFLAALLSGDPEHLHRYERYLQAYPTAGAVPGGVAEVAFIDLLCRTGVPRSRLHEPGRRTLPSPLGRVADRMKGRAEPDRFPVDQLRRMLLWIAAGPRNAFELDKLGGLIRPDPTWVADFSRFVGHDSPYLGEYLDRLRDVAERGRRRDDGEPPDGQGPTSDALLGESTLGFVRATGDRLVVEWQSLRRHPSLIRTLRGDNPELRPVIALALSDAMPPGEGLARIAGWAAEVVPIAASDLLPSAVPRTDDPRATSTLLRLVEYVDRSGVMRPFLTAVAAELPTAGLLQRVVRAFTVWDDAQDRLLRVLEATLQGTP